MTTGLAGMACSPGVSIGRGLASTWYDSLPPGNSVPASAAFGAVVCQLLVGGEWDVPVLPGSGRDGKPACGAAS